MLHVLLLWCITYADHCSEYLHSHVEFSKDLECSARQVYEAVWRDYKSLPGTVDDILWALERYSLTILIPPSWSYSLMLCG